jgi:hypothetical protein
MDDLDYHGQSHQPHFGTQHKKSKKKLFIILGIIGGVLVLGGGGAAAFLLMHKSDKPAPATTQQTSTRQTTTQQQTPTGVQSNGTNYTYKSTTLNVGVTYPKTWTMRESNDKKEIILTSPQTQYVKKDGTNTQGVFTVKLRNGIIPDGIKTTVQNAIAVADSQVIAYAKPTTDQRQYTNLSYVGPDANSFSFGIITGYTAYKAGQAVGGGIDLNGQAYLFAGGYGTDAADTLTFDPIPKANYDTAVFKQAGAIFESLQLY